MASTIGCIFCKCEFMINITTAAGTIIPPAAGAIRLSGFAGVLVQQEEHLLQFRVVFRQIPDHDP